MPKKTTVIKPEEEYKQQMQVVEYMRWKKIKGFSVPNGSYIDKRQGNKLKKMGLTPGIPDLLIVQPPPRFPDMPGVALEMKRAPGWGEVSDVQQEWLDIFSAFNWISHVGWGADDAIKFLKYLGY